MILFPSEEQIIAFVAEYIPYYTMLLIKADGCDFKGKSERFRQYLLGVRIGCLRLPFHEWFNLLLRIRTPRHHCSVLPYLLDSESSEVKAELARISSTSRAGAREDQASQAASGVRKAQRMTWKVAPGSAL